MKTILLNLPDFISLSGMSVGITSLTGTNILNNSGVPESITNIGGDLFSANIEENFTGWYRATVYHNSGWIAKGNIKFGSLSGYYLVDDPSARFNDYAIPAANLPQVTGMNLSIFKGITWNINISGIGLDADDFYFTMKPSHHVPDSSCALQLNTSGTKYLNSVEQNHSSGVLTYSADGNGTINISVNPVITSQLQAGIKYVWDIKGIDTEVTIRSFGSISVKEDVTDAIS